MTVLYRIKRWNNLPLHNSHDIAFIDFLSSGMGSEDTKIITELFEVLVSGLSNGLKGLIAHYR